jgi:hypothetical protein
LNMSAGLPYPPTGFTATSIRPLDSLPIASPKGLNICS